MTTDMTAAMNTLIQQLSGITSTMFENNDPMRQQLALAARRVFHELETPGEKSMRLAIEEPVMFSVLQTTIDTGVWESWKAAGGGEKNINELAESAKVDIDPQLLREC